MHRWAWGSGLARLGAVATWRGGLVALQHWACLSPWSCLGTSHALVPGGPCSQRPSLPEAGPVRQVGPQHPLWHLLLGLWAPLWHLAWFQTPEIIREQDGRVYLAPWSFCPRRRCTVVKSVIQARAELCGDKAGRREGCWASRRLSK